LNPAQLAHLGGAVVNLAIAEAEAASFSAVGDILHRTAALACTGPNAGSRAKNMARGLAERQSLRRAGGDLA
jgi:hypothetical protein